MADERPEGHIFNDAMPRTQPHHTSGPSRRTQYVFASFAVAMTAAMIFLAIDAPRHAGGFPLTSITPLEDRPTADHDQLLRVQARIEPTRWEGIVVHHLGEPFGTAESVHRQHLSWDYQGLGYHFLVGNGNGLGDGEIHVGYRWIEQLAGAHVVGPAGGQYNGHTLGICLIGNGDRQPFTKRQVLHLSRLVQRLQQDLDIPRDRVVLHRDIAPDSTGSPGRLFPEAEFQAQLLDLPR